jgi:hypothetical protein
VAQVGASKGRKVRERTINFYQIKKYKNRSVNEKIKHSDWNAILGTLVDVPLGKRVWNGPTRTLIGEVLKVDENLHLKLMLVRDQDQWLDVYDPDAQSIKDLDLGEAGQLLETSIIAFLPYGNVFGIIQGSTTAPTPSAFTDWLNGLKILGIDGQVEAEVMVSHEAQKLINQSSEATQIEVKMHTNKADALEKQGSKLSQILRTVSAEWGPMTVTVILRASKAKDRTEGRALLRAEASRIQQATDDNDVSSAKAKLVYFDADETSRSEEVDFVKQRITAKKKIATTGEDGSPIRNTSAVAAILGVAADYDEELRAIVRLK